MTIMPVLLVLRPTGFRIVQMKIIYTDEPWRPLINYEWGELNIYWYVSKIWRNDEKYREAFVLHRLNSFKVQTEWSAILAGGGGRDGER